MSTPPPLPSDEPPRRQTSLIVLLVFLCIGLVALIVWRSASREEVEIPAEETTSHTNRKPKRTLDLEKLVSGYPDHQEYFRQLEAATLAEYDRANPSDKPWYAEGRQAAQLYAAFAVWDDLHGQGVLEVADDFASIAFHKGCRDPLISNICEILTFQTRYSSKNRGAQDHIRHTRDLDESRYPALFKLIATQALLKNFAATRQHQKDLDDDFTSSWAEIPGFFSTAGQEFAALLTENVPNAVIFSRANDFFDDIQETEYLVPVAAEIEKAFESAAPDHATRAAIRGNFLVSWAWQARGSGWASSVTEEGHRLMVQRLDQANEMLTAAYEKNPKDYLSATVMIGVELGQGNGREIMEKWFERAMQDQPDNVKACTSKMWYLQPRWYGTPDEVVEFGRECVKSGNWKGKIPLVLPVGIGRMADLQEDLYRYDQVWNLVAPVYEEYLKRYPDSIVTRTAYADCAARGNRLDVLRTQLTALGPNWDRAKWPDKEYRRISQLARQP